MYKQLKENPIELFDNSKPFVLENKVYAHASNLPYSGDTLMDAEEGQ